MDKSPDAFRTISEVAEHLETPAHVLRFWESRFPQIRPVKRAGGRRYYRPSDVALLTGIKRLLHDEGMTIRGVQKILREQGVRHVAALSGEDLGVNSANYAESFFEHAEETPVDVVVQLRPEPAPAKATPGLAAALAKVADSGQSFADRTRSVQLPEAEPAQGTLLLTPTALPPEVGNGELDAASANPAVEDTVDGLDASFDEALANISASTSDDAVFPEAFPGVDDFEFEDDVDAGQVTPLAAKIRALPDDASAKPIAAELTALVARLKNLRDRMADAVHPGLS